MVLRVVKIVGVLLVFGCVGVAAFLKVYHERGLHCRPVLGPSPEDLFLTANLIRLQRAVSSSMLWLSTSKSCGAAPHDSKAIPWHSAAAVEVSTLQQRVVALQQSHEVQDKELAHLRAEVLALAARTAAASTGLPGMPGSAQRSSGSSGNRGGTGDMQAHQLQQQVAQLQETNTWLQLQLEEYQSQLQALEGDKGHLLDMLAGSEAAARAAGTAATAAAEVAAASPSNGSSGSSLAVAAGVASSGHRRRSYQQQQEQQGLPASCWLQSARVSCCWWQQQAEQGHSNSSSSLSNEQLRSQLQDEVSRRQRAEADLAQFMAAMEEAG